MRIKIGIILIMCIFSVLSPVCAQAITSQGDSPYDSTLYVYPTGTYESEGSVLDIESGQTGHISIKLVAKGAPEMATEGQLINLQVQKLNENGVWQEVNYPSFNFYKVITGKGGRATIHIRTFQVIPGIYKVRGYYAGNENDVDVDDGYKLHESNGWCGLVIHPPNEIWR